ncbi:MAG: nucleotidyltransferase family protein [Caldisericia bacterium]|nr:nucleotidyltransferase family protein [Caldisericia bacterium]
MNKDLLENLIKILRSYGATEIILFGSYARGENRPDSDIDVIVEFNETKGLFKKAEIIRVIYEKLGVHIDLLSKNYINPFLRPYIERDMKVLYPS